MLSGPILLNIHMFGIMVTIGLLSAFFVLFYYAKRLSISEKVIDFVFYDGIVSIFFGFASAAIFQAMYNYIRNPEYGFHLGSGITFIGGLIGGAGCFLISYYIFHKRLGEKLLVILPVIPCAITIAHGFGRIGCFFAGCCYGRESNCIFAIKFPGMINAVHPTQLYETVFLFLLFGVLSLLVLKIRYKFTMSIYLIAYGVFRFFIEFLRGDDRGQFIGAFSPSQFWAIIMILVGIILYYIHRKLCLKNTGNTLDK